MVEIEPDRVQSAAKYDRLARIKTKYDPENIFPSTPTSSLRESSGCPPSSAVSVLVRSAVGGCLG
jgi:hypothetical protein